MRVRGKFVAALAAVVVVIAGCSAPVNLSVGQPPEQATLDAESVETNLDQKDTLAAGERIEIAAILPWHLEDVQIVRDGATEQIQVENPREWRSEPLAPKQKAVVRATLGNPQSGQQHSVERRVVVGKAEKTFTAKLFPADGSYGIGVIPTITFSQPVPEKDRQTVLSRVSVQAEPTPVSGAWRWLDRSTAAFRPASFWPGHTKVRITGDLTGVRVSKTGSTPSAWGAKDVRSNWRTGEAMIVNLNARTLSGKVTIDGKRKRTFPISLGKSGFITRSGTKTLTVKYRVKRMTNLGITDDEVYDLQVPYAMQLTDSGEFLHGAPWNGNIGYAHTSHGCSNLKLADARYIFERMQWGAPVITTGTGRPMESWNGPGGLWNIPASSWA